MDKLIEGVDYFCHFVKFANRANPALTVVNPDGTYDIYFNTLYETERLREELPHELRHIQERHFDVDISVERAERQADGEPLCIIGHTAPDRIPHFFSEDHFAHWVKTLAAQRGVDLASERLQAREEPGWEKTRGKRKQRTDGV